MTDKCTEQTFKCDETSGATPVPYGADMNISKQTICRMQGLKCPTQKNVLYGKMWYFRKRDTKNGINWC